MDDGGLGSFGSFVPIWTATMAAMMLPSAAPMVVVHSQVERRRRELARGSGWGATAAFVGGYLLVWIAFGLVAYALFELVRALGADALSWDSGGQYLAAGAIAIAAGYELTPLKSVCLSKCRSPLAFVVGSWRDGRRGAARMGIEHGSWCVGCCWLVMATLFALGVMSVAWMALIAALVALEKLLPWQRVATLGVAAVLGCLAASVALGFV